MSSISAHLLGTELIVRTTSGETFRGELYCYDIQESNSFVLQEHIGRGRVNYHWMKCSTVRDIQATALNQVNIESMSLPAIDVSSLQAQEKRAQEFYANYKDTIGVGVSQVAQDIFDSLAKTMPCSWSGDVIQCYRVKISPPYTSASCEGPDDNELTRVKKVLDGERAKLDKKRQLSQ